LKWCANVTPTDALERFNEQYPKRTSFKESVRTFRRSSNGLFLLDASKFPAIAGALRKPSVRKPRFLQRSHTFEMSHSRAAGSALCAGTTTDLRALTRFIRKTETIPSLSHVTNADARFLPLARSSGAAKVQNTGRVTVSAAWLVSASSLDGCSWGFVYQPPATVQRRSSLNLDRQPYRADQAANPASCIGAGMDMSPRWIKPGKAPQGPVVDCA
jgi:hypothetical protein